MRKIVLFLAALMLLTSLSGCGRRQDIWEQIESEKAAESAAEESNVVTMGGGRETVAPEPGTQKPDVPVDTAKPDNPTDTTTPDDPQETYKPPVPTVPDPNDKYPTHAGYQLTAGINKGGNGAYAGVTADDLLGRYDGCYIGVSANFWNAPMGIFFEIQTKYSFYNKLTKNFTPMCPDPLCRHTDCIWGYNNLQFVYANDTHLYFLASMIPARPKLFRCDLNRNHVEALEVTIYGNDQFCYAEGDRVYLQRTAYKEGQTGDLTFCVLDCNTKEITTIYDKESVWILAVTGGDTVWYQHFPDETVIYKTDLNFSHSEKVSEGNKMTVMMSNDDYLLIGEYKDGLYIESFLYHIATEKQTNVPSGMSVQTYSALDSHYLYYTKTISDAEIAVSPLKEYYNYQISQEGWTYQPGMMMGDGRIWRFNLETGEEELCAEISYNGIPIWITDFVADGDAVYIAYRTYKDYRNYYNQNHGESMYDFAPNQYLYVDMTNGTLNLLNP